MLTPSEIYVGMKYINNSCRLTVVEKPVKNGVKCKCDICGAVDGYSVQRFKEGLIYACKSCQGNVKLGETYGKNLKAHSFTINNDRFLVIMQCIVCNKRFYHSVEQIKSKNYCCPVCNKIGIARPNSNNTITPVKIMAKQVKPLANTVKINKINKPIQDNKVEDKKYKKDEYKSLLGDIIYVDDNRKDITNYKMIGKYMIIGKNLRVSATGASITRLLKVQCTKCGKISTVQESKTDKLLEKESCSSCKNIDNINKRNMVQNINWVGYTKNNLQITRTTTDENGIIKAAISCLICGEEQVLPLAVFIYEKEIVCFKCGDSKIHMRCPVCGKNHLALTPRSLYSTKQDGSIAYAKCGDAMIPYSEIAVEHETKVRMESLRHKYKGYELLQRIEGRDSFATVLKLNEHYTGTDGEEYFTCMCAEHNKLMVLTESEMMQYTHEYCADTRMMAYNSKKKPKI